MIVFDTETVVEPGVQITVSTLEDFLREASTRTPPIPIEQIAKAMIDDGFASWKAHALAAAARMRYGNFAADSVATGSLRAAIEMMAVAAKAARVADLVDKSSSFFDPITWQRNRLEVAGQIIEIRATHDNPQLVLLRNFASMLECETVLQSSRTQPAHLNEQDTDRESRHELDVACTTIVERLQQRAAQVLAVPVEALSPMQIVRHAAGTVAEPQDDQAMIVSISLHLNAVHSSVVFPARGVRIPARQGDAYLFIEADANCCKHPGALRYHETIGAGEKWIAIFSCTQA